MAPPRSLNELPEARALQEAADQFNRDPNINGDSRNQMLWRIARAYVDLFVAGKRAEIKERVDLGALIHNSMEAALIHELIVEEMGDRLAQMADQTNGAVKEVVKKPKK